MLADDELRLHLATGDGPARPFKEHLEFLRPVMGCAVILRCRQEPCIVGLVYPLHQRRNKLICRQASQNAVFRRNNHVEAPCGLCDHILPGEPV